MMVNKWDLIREINKYIDETKQGMNDFDYKYAGEDIEEILEEYLRQEDMKRYTRLQWEIRKYETNQTIIEER